MKAGSADSLDSGRNCCKSELGSRYRDRATITSAAVINAVGDCLTQAGADPAAWMKETAANAQQDQSADVVVVGGGGLVWRPRLQLHRRALMSSSLKER
ncbi:MAG: hypothetical protein ACLSA6_06870 [Holdemania massiliensis]